MIPTQMHSGLASFSSDNHDQETVHKIQCILITMIQQATEHAGVYAKAAKRNTITPTDMKLALQYCAHEFFKEDDSLLPKLERNWNMMHNDADVTDMLKYMRDVKEYADSDEESVEESGEESVEKGEESEEDGFTEATIDDPMIIKMNQYNAGWAHWQPTDEVQRSLKNAIDRV
jgi:hypothetical protein